jgi:hypothetical protein
VTFVNVPFSTCWLSCVFLCIFSCHPESFCFSVPLVKGFYVVENCRRIENFSDRTGRIIIGPTDFSFQYRTQEFSIVTAGQPKGLVLATQQQKESFSIKSNTGLWSTHLVLGGGFFPQGQSSQAWSLSITPIWKLRTVWSCTFSVWNVSVVW